jgi:recombinational DNA repair protein RecR
MHVLQFLLKGSDDTLADLTLEELEKLLQEGPTRDARCIACGNFTTGDKCEECIPGTFRGSEDYRSSCRPYVTVFSVYL